MIKYDDASCSLARDCIEQYMANMGGTNMLDPLKEAFNLKSKRKVRIFILTDGYVNSGPGPVLDLIETKCLDENDEFRLFSFGIGDHCDTDFVRNAAEKGRGSHHIVNG